MNVDTQSIYTVLITLVTVLGSSAAFKFYEKRIQLKQNQESYVKDNCEERIEKLEILLAKSSDEKEILRDQILKLTEQVSALRVKVEYLEKENRDLSKNKK